MVTRLLLSRSIAVAAQLELKNQRAMDAFR